MANTYDLTQTGSEVQAILNDANNIKGAGAQTTLTTDYILLKDTNGQYHKILKDSFTEACRNVLAGLLVNNDKGTTISQIAAIASGDFGSVTPTNLASLLGAMGRLGDSLTGNEDVNDLKTVGGSWGVSSGTVAAGISNLPTSSSGRLMVLPLGGASRIIQIYISNDSIPVFYFRRWANSWGSWSSLTSQIV